ncbi:unnamed protein product [Xylocopa violacea]|uniref:Uncharacterized protein n=1 Tax=Xylocopa violacea TaxID=135666 RepID=A0ABP1N1A0_XYLVO
MTSQKIVPRSLILWLVVLGMWRCTGEKLSPDQKAPPFARGSGGLILNTPFDDNKARFRPMSNGNVPADGVQREETEMLKLVDGNLVRTVEGSFAYNSPEGLPISVKYQADENGNRASFKFGTGTVDTKGSAGKPPGSRVGQNGYNGKTDQGAKDGGAKDSTYLPPKGTDRSYLPPQ